MSITILDAIDDRNLFGQHLKSKRTWQAWRVILAATFGLPINVADWPLYQKLTGRSVAPTEQVAECWIAAGRRGGKSFTTALTATYLAAFRDYSPYLAPGEKATVMVIAADRAQARTVIRYIKGLFQKTPLLKSLVVNETAESLELSNHVVIEINTASIRSVRGYTLAAAVLDEVAYWRSDESANPDKDILAAIRPAMASIPNSLLLAISSPYSRRGVLYETWKRHYGKDASRILVVQACTRDLNPTISQEFINAQYEEDPANAAAEFGGQFRSDIETFVSREALDAIVAPGRHELPPVSGVRHFGFVDPSGGSQDAMTLAIAHLEGDAAVLDAVREVKPPFSPEAVVLDFATLLKSYGLSEVTGDRYGGEWPRERFKVHGIDYRLSDKTRSDLYREVLPRINSGRAELLDHARLVAQFAALERRTGRGGKDSIDHAPGSHDDLANAVAGALVLAASQSKAAPIVAPISVWEENYFACPSFCN